MANAPLISVTDLIKTYGKGDSAVRALRGVSLSIQAGEWVTITGPSGSGKTTLLNVLGALDAHYTGSVQISGEELGQLSDRRLSRFRGETLGFVFQSFNLLPHLSVIENVTLPGFFTRSKGRENRARAVDLLGRVGLADKRDALPDQLSGGQQQRVAVARALFNRTRLLLCDEPTGALDRASSAQVMDLFGSLNQDEAITLIVVTHQAEIGRRAQRAIHLVDGKITYDGPSDGLYDGDSGGQP